MARLLQKKKTKSSLPRIRQKPKSKRINIKSNPIVAANWDSKLTLSQNYRRLGLSSKLNAHTGGTEVKGIQTEDELKKTGGLAIPSSRAAKKLGIAEVKVIKNPKSGAIISVQDESARKVARNPLGDPLNELSDPDDEEHDAGYTGANRGIVPELVESAKYEKKKRPRQQSQREREWIKRLVDKWGDDWGGMFRDRKLNIQQQSEVDLRRRVAVWRRRGECQGGEVEDTEFGE